MRFRIETLGPFKLVDLRSDSTIPLRSNSRLLSYLAVRAPQSVSRKALVGELWPDVDAPTANNRLRVALNKLRQLMPDAIAQTSDGLSLDLEVVESDVVEFLKLVQGSKDTSTEEDEFEGLTLAVRYFTRNLGPAKFEDWSLDDLAEPLEVLYNSCLRLAELGFRLREERRVCEMVETVLLLWPKDVALWKIVLQGRLNLGQGELAVRDITATKDRALLANKEIRALMNRIVNEAPEPDDGELPFTAAESRLAVEILKTMMLAKPDVARVILSSPETLTLAGAHPRQMLSLLERAVAGHESGDEHWERCLARIVGLKAWLSEPDGVFEYGQKVVEQSTNPVMLRAVWNAIALAHSLRRQWPEAMAAIDTTIQYAEQTDQEINVLSALGNRALFLWHQRQFEESLYIYNWTLARLQEIGTEQAKFEYVLGAGNRVFIPVMQGDWPLALEWLEECYDLRTNGPVKVRMGSLLSCLAMARLMMGKREELLPMIRQSFFEANSYDSRQSQMVIFEFSAYSLAQTNQKGFARSVVDWVEDWRGRINLPRSEAEQGLCDLMCGSLQADVTLTAEDVAPKVGRELLSRLRIALGD